MRPKPSEPGRGLSVSGVYFLKAQRGYTTGSRSPSGQEGRGGGRGGGGAGGGRPVCVWVTLVFPEPTPGQLQQE